MALVGKTYRKHVPQKKKKDRPDRRRRSLKTNKQRRPNDRTALRKEYR